MIKKRHFEIINLIINSYNGITIKNIADLCNVTERSIRYDINEVNVFFKKKNNKDIIEINNNKLKILYDKKEIEKVIREISVGEYYLSEDERTDIFSYEIFLLKNEFILQYFSEKYGLSKTTIRYSLKEVDRVIQEYNLAIEMSNKGYKVVGNEINIRKYIINILRKYLKIIKEKNTEYNPYIDIVEKFLSKNDIEFFKVLISEILNKTKKTVSDEVFETLQLFSSSFDGKK